MDVKLVVSKGKHAGREIPISIPKFFVGRAEDCQLRVHSELVSRHHCVFVVEEGFVAVRDFHSKNGTFVNGDRITPEVELKPGDRVQVGPLEFEVQISVARETPKSAPRQDRVETAARSEPSGDGFLLEDRQGGEDKEEDTVTMFPADLAKIAEKAGSQAGASVEPERRNET